MGVRGPTKQYLTAIDRIVTWSIQFNQQHQKPMILNHDDVDRFISTTLTTKVHLLCTLTMSVNTYFKQIFQGSTAYQTNKSEGAVVEMG